MKGNTWVVVRGSLSDSTRSVIGWTLGAALVAVFYLSFYPLIGSDQMNEMFAIMPEGMLKAFNLTGYTTVAGYANTTVYTLLGLIILLIFAITLGARFIGGEEESGTPELEYTASMSRTQIYVGRVCALWCGVIVAAIGLTVAVSLLSLIANLGLDMANVWLCAIAVALIVGAFGSISLATGATTGRRSLALSVAGGLAVLAYLVNIVGQMASISWMAAISPFHWYAGNLPLENGLAWDGMGYLTLLAAVPAVIGWAALRRRDLMAWTA